MCGLVGIWRYDAQWSGALLEGTAKGMAAAIEHRGPDAHGLWADAAKGLVLAHRRLAIVDLTSAGAQPMHSHCGQYVLVFNGEIYNFEELRADLLLAGVAVRSTGDTEVMLQAFVLWGVAATCQRMAGMFAFALWDRQLGQLTLGRDRLGKKPLYVCADAAGLAFASELKALWRVPGFAPQIDRSAMAEFFRFGYVSEQVCILSGVFKVQPGELLTVRGRASMQREPYWRLSTAAAQPRRYGPGDTVEAKAELLSRLQEATRTRMLADVPLGAFLSGGIDSGLVVAMMQRAGMGQTRTFSIGFEESSHDEAPVARAVAQHLGTAHTELYVSQAQALAVVPKLADVFDEPFADASQIPTTLLAQLARRHVTVALTGDGGDEAFGGYMRYRNEKGLTGALYRMAPAVRHGTSTLLRAVPAAAWDKLAHAVPRRRRPRFLASKVSKFVRALELDTPQARAREYLSIWRPEQLLQPDVMEGALGLADIALPEGLDSSEAMQYWETLHYLPGDLLTKMDRASMSASLEARSPLLDHRVVELAWQLHPELKAGSRALKFLLRQALFDYVPRELVDLPKQGFSVPIGAWMVKQLRPFIEDLLDYSCNHLSHLIQPLAVTQAWQAHLQGKAGQTEKIWAVAMFALWFRRWMVQMPGVKT